MSVPVDVKCQLCGEPMPKGEEMFNYHGYSGPCPKPPLSRPKQTNCQQEPSYPDHETVVFAMIAPDMTCHLPSSRCTIQEPHLIRECGEFVHAPSPVEATPCNCTCHKLNPDATHCNMCLPNHMDVARELTQPSSAATNARKNHLLRRADEMLHELMDRDDLTVADVKKHAADAHAAVHGLAGLLSDDPVIREAAAQETTP